MSEAFITMVASMRDAQRFDEERHTRRSAEDREKLETRVDEWLLKHVVDVAQLDFWIRSVKSTEEPGAYNVTDEVEEKNESGA